MKKPSKAAQKATLRFLEQSIKEQDCSKEKKEEMIRYAKEMYQKEMAGLQEPKETVKFKIENSFYFKNGKEYTSSLEILETQQHYEVFNEVIFEKMNNDDFRVFYDDSLIDESCAYVAYKINDKLIVEQCFLDENSNKFELDLELVVFAYPKERKLSKEEKQKFLDKFYNYNLIENIFITCKETEELSNTLEIPVSKENKRKIFVGMFWRYGAILAGFVMFCIVSILCLNVEEIGQYAKILIPLSFGTPMFIVGMDYILACIFKWPHILLVDQSTKHLKMNPDTASWKTFSYKDIILAGIVFAVLGLAMIILSFVI